MFEPHHKAAFTTLVSEGYVLLEGPCVAVTLNPQEALLIAEKLTAAATHATGQRSDT